MSETSKIDPLSMSLDDYAKQTQRKPQRRRGSGRYRVRRYGSSNRNSNRNQSNFQGRRMRRRPIGTRRDNYKRRPRYTTQYNNSRRRRKNQQKENKKVTSKTRLMISDLNPIVTNSELKKIFETLGPLKRCGIHFDKLGNSKGTADVEYEKAEDAEKAVKELNNSDVEGKVMTVSYSKLKIKKRIFRKRLGTKRFKNLNK